MSVRVSHARVMSGRTSVRVYVCAMKLEILSERTGLNSDKKRIIRCMLFTSLPTFATNVRMSRISVCAYWRYFEIFVYSNNRTTTRSTSIFNFFRSVPSSPIRLPRWCSCCCLTVTFLPLFYLVLISRYSNNIYTRTHSERAFTWCLCTWCICIACTQTESIVCEQRTYSCYTKTSKYVFLYASLDMHI